MIFSMEKKFKICSNAFLYVAMIDISATEILAHVKKIPGIPT